MSGYDACKHEALYELRHAVEQVEKDQCFNALVSAGKAVAAMTGALQILLSRKGR